MQYLLDLSGSNSGRTISLRKKICHMVNTRRIVSGEAAESSYYAGEGGTCEMKP